MTDLGICQGVGGQVGESYEYVLLSSSVSLKPIDSQQCSKTRSVSILSIFLPIDLSSNSHGRIHVLEIWEIKFMKVKLFIL